jgi:hypothetical protein
MARVNRNPFEGDILMKGLFYRAVTTASALLVAACFLVESASATTAILLTDEQLITSSRVILLGDVRSVKAQWGPKHENINTYVKVQISSVLKGHLQNEQIVFRQLGGTVGDSSTVIFGAPDYKVGQRVLLFLDTAPDGTLRIAHLFQGKYDVVDGQDGQTRVDRNIDKESVNILGPKEGPGITRTALLGRFLKKIKKTLDSNPAVVAAFEAGYQGVPIVETPPEYVDGANDPSQTGDLNAQYTLLGQGFRWFEPDSNQPVTYRLNQTAAPIAGGGVTEINQAFAAWTNVQTTSLVIQNAGSTTANGFQQDGVSAISFDDPLGQMSPPVGCSGTLAIGGVSSAGGQSIVIGGQAFIRTLEGDVVFNKNFQCFLGISANLAEVATHEIGHTLGFGHSADPNATMYATAHGDGRGATLGSDDIAVVSFVYPGSKTSQPPSPVYQGYHDVADCQTISGWAWDRNQPNTATSVDIYDGTSLIATVAANQFRQDLLNAGIGNGIHGFSFTVPASLKNGVSHSIRVRFAGTATDLTNSPKTITCGGSTPFYQGYHDVADCQTIAGWAWDRNQPNTAISVDVYDGTTLIATVAANQFRQDLLNAGIGNGIHGFSFTVPASLKNGVSHSIRVRFAGTTTDLTNSPKTITCGGSTPFYQGYHDGADCLTIAGWAWDRNQPNTAINVDIYDGTTLIGTVAANQFRQDLLNAGIGNGIHGFNFTVPSSLKNGASHSIRVRFAGTTTDLTNTPRTITCTGP